jgi:hypothetical protein
VVLLGVGCFKVVCFVLISFGCLCVRDYSWLDLLVLCVFR